ncbi:MAG: hypothetical protein LBL35_07355 [Clostridiales bacterium]|jgi:hypothetical protein|nr:hypothetical protein [Clostridiales bacterium]
MKRFVFIVILLLGGISVLCVCHEKGAFDVGTENQRLEAEVIYNESGIPHLADGEAGKGIIETPSEYWVKNGYPDNIAFAYEAGGEKLEDGVSLTYWEIGVVGGGKAEKKLFLIWYRLIVAFHS